MLRNQCVRTEEKKIQFFFVEKTEFYEAQSIVFLLFCLDKENFIDSFRLSQMLNDPFLVYVYFNLPPHLKTVYFFISICFNHFNRLCLIKIYEWREIERGQNSQQEYRSLCLQPNILDAAGQREGLMLILITHHSFRISTRIFLICARQCAQMR